jgi:hypothetical protein
MSIVLAWGCFLVCDPAFSSIANTPALFRHDFSVLAMSRCFVGVQGVSFRAGNLLCVDDLTAGSRGVE